MFHRWKGQALESCVIWWQNVVNIHIIISATFHWFYAKFFVGIVGSNLYELNMSANEYMLHIIVYEKSILHERLCKLICLLITAETSMFYIKMNKKCSVLFCTKEPLEQSIRVTILLLFWQQYLSTKALNQLYQR